MKMVFADSGKVLFCPKVNIIVFLKKMYIGLYFNHSESFRLVKHYTRQRIANEGH